MFPLDKRIFSTETKKLRPTFWMEGNNLYPVPVTSKKVCTLASIKNVGRHGTKFSNISPCRDVTM